MAEEKPGSGNTGDAFANIAFWEFMAFIMILCFVWVNEIFDFAHRVFDAEPTPFNFYRACILSAAVIAGGVVAVGHTYERQRRLMSRLMMTCLYCHRVKTASGIWEHLVEYFMRIFPVNISRGACPECQRMLDAVDERSGTPGVPGLPGSSKPAS